MLSITCLNKWLKKVCLLVLCAWVSGFAAMPAMAQMQDSRTFLLDASLAPRVDIGSYLQVLVDESNQLSLQQVLSEEYQGLWLERPGFLRSYGYTDSAYWFRLRIRNVSSFPVNWLIEIEQPELKELDFHLVSAGQLLMQWNAGIKHPFSQRVFQHRNFVFPVPMQGNQSLDLVFRVKTDGPMLLPVSISEQVAFAEKEQFNLLLLGLLLGSMLVLALYHAYMYLSAGGFRHLILGIYISCLLMFVVSAKGLGYQFLWPESPTFNMQAVKFFAWLAILWGVSYLLEFLEIRRKHPRLIWLISIFLLVFSLMYIGSMFFYVPRLDAPLRVFHVLVFMVYLGMAARLWWRGTLGERYLGLSLFAMFAAGLVYLAYIMGYIDHSTLAVSALDYGLALGAGFLTLSLAEQIRQERIHQEMAFHRMLSQESELRAIREEALYQQERENQKLKTQVRSRDVELSMVMEHLRESHDRLESMGGMDGLTGLFNIRRFRELLKAACCVPETKGRDASLLIIDLDDFRQINEQQGHVMGDEVLRTISFFMRSVATRPNDLLARFGGEEMAIFLPETDREGALVVAERLRRIIADHSWPSGKDGLMMAITVSIGVATLVPESVESADMLVNQAKLALKRAKGQGKNQVIAFEFIRARPEES